MTDTTMDPVAAFDEARPQLFAVAYRLLGTVTDAEDVLQDAYLRWQGADRRDVESPAAYLTTIVTRLCLDVLKSARVQREVYVGPWLPEPLIDAATGPAETAEMADSLSMAFLVLLESLTPLERAAFVLRQVFGYEYAELAAVLDRDEAACRQLVSRAKSHVESRRPRATASRSDGERLVTEFLTACATGDVDGLMDMLAPDVVLRSDGGGVVSAARRPIYGADDVARFMVGVTKQGARTDFTVDLARINGDPGCVVRIGGDVAFVMSLDVLDGTIAGVHVVRNPAKLTHLHAT
ncbi:MAG: sigma-70 family RNA polymerase sigma factor [Mycobacteriales bacterium]